MCENIGGFTEIPEQPSSEDMLGGLIDLTQEPLFKKEGDVNSEAAPFDPLSLLEMEAMEVDAFFKLDRDTVYTRLSRLQSLPDDNPAKIRSTKILQILEEGKESYCSKNLEEKTVRF